MVDYRIYLINSGGRRQRPIDVECASDDDALARAHEILDTPDSKAEVWCGLRLVNVLSRIGATQINGFASPGGEMQFEN